MRSASSRDLNTPPLNSTAVGWMKLAPADVRREAFQLGHGAGLAAEERGQVARDRGVLRVGQAELREAGARAADRARRRPRPAGRSRRASVARDVVARQLGADRAADQLASRGSGTTIGCARRCGVGRAAVPWRRGRRRSARAAARRRAACRLRPSLRATTCASARSMLSPPSRMWSPTATRCSSRSPSRSSTAISEKSLVPPPTSTTRMTSPACTCLRQPPPLRLDPAVERRLRLLEQRRRRQSRRPGPPRASARARPDRTRPAS